MISYARLNFSNLSVPVIVSVCPLLGHCLANEYHIPMVSLLALLGTFQKRKANVTLLSLKQPFPPFLF